MAEWTQEMEALLGELKVGKGHAIPAYKLATKLRMRQKEAYKTVQRLVRLLVLDGIPISGCKFGFYLIDNRDEYLETIEMLKERVNKLKLRIRKLKGYMGSIKSKKVG